MPWLKQKIKDFIERLLDRVLDFIVPYKILSYTAFQNLVFHKKIPCAYVLNQKIQRLQILALLREIGIENPPELKAWWSRGLHNFGDELLPYLLAHIAGVECVFDRKKSFISIGSIVRFAENHTTVWGSGMIKQNEVMTGKPKCLAVRGPLTRDKLLKNGISCPEVYGDPAMLFPLFYKPKKKEIQGQALIVPHFKHTSLIKHHVEYEYLDLHVHSLKDIENIIDRITSASQVITSSLHAFIFCVAYGIPVAVFKLEEQGIGGDNIKFNDFCYGVSLDPITIHTLNDENKKDVSQLIDKARIYTPQWSPLPLLEALTEICPTPTLQSFIKNLSQAR